jgi:hypothetical protein
VPRFDDEDDSSSSDSDDEEPATKSLTKKAYTGTSSDNNEDDRIESAADVGPRTSPTQPQQSFQGDVQWDRVQELQELTNANATLTSEARELRQQLKAYVP